MKRIILIVLHLLVLVMPALACDCKYISKQAEYELAYSILVGEVVSTDSDGFKVSVSEELKGNKSDSLITIISDNCSVYPQQGEVWLLYLVLEEGNLSVSRCGWSRSFSHPFRIGSENTPPPPNFDSDVQVNSVFENIYKNKALNELYFDILTMRNQKMTGLIEKMDSDSKSGFNEIESKMTWGLVVVIISMLLIFLSVVTKTRKNR